MIIIISLLHYYIYTYITKIINIIFTIILFLPYSGWAHKWECYVLTDLNTGYGVGFTITQWTDFKFMLLFNVTWIRRQQSTKISFWTQWSNSTRWEHDHRENWLPWWKNSSVTFSLHCLLSSHGLHGLQISAHFRAIWNTRQFGLKCPKVFVFITNFKYIKVSIIVTKTKWNKKIYIWIKLTNLSIIFLLFSLFF